MNDYEVTVQMAARLENDYSYHTPFGTQQERYVAIRDKAKELAYLIVRNSPTSREQSVALTHLDGVVMNANAAIARNEKEFNQGRQGDGN
jgi:hypothetical protein